jgi:hypothetical protein
MDDVHGFHYVADTQFGPWNPGLQSDIPHDLRHLCTIFRPENTFTTFADASEMHDLTGSS